MKYVKTKLYISAVVIFTLCLILLSVAIPVYSIASSKSYYLDNFEKAGLYNTSSPSPVFYIGGTPASYAHFSDSQIEQITNHIIDFLFGSKQSFSLTLDSVVLNKTLSNNVEIFSPEAVSHMADVKSLVNIATVAFWIVLALFIALGLYIFLGRKSHGKLIFKTGIFVILSLISLALIFFGFVFVKAAVSPDGLTLDSFSSEMWTCMHYLFFPFSPEKVEGSFFNDTLTSLLSLDFFMSACIITVSTLISVLALYLCLTFIYSKKQTPKKHSLLRRK